VHRLENMIGDVSKVGSAFLSFFLLRLPIMISSVRRFIWGHIRRRCACVSGFQSRFATVVAVSYSPQLMIAPPLTGASMHFHYTAGTGCAFSMNVKRWFLINPAQAMYTAARKTIEH
jgi:hypothetical protein